MEGERGEILGAAASLSLGGGLLGYSRTLPTLVLAGQPEFIGPSFSPTIVGTILVLLSLVQLLHTLWLVRNKKSNKNEGKSTPEGIRLFALD